MSPHKRKANLSPWVHDQGDDYFDTGRAATSDCADGGTGGAHGGGASGHAPEPLAAPLSALAGRLPSGRTRRLRPWEPGPSCPEPCPPHARTPDRPVGPHDLCGFQPPAPHGETRGGSRHRPLAPDGPPHPPGRRSTQPPAAPAAPLPTSA